ncbi:MAG: MFS transporter [Polyangiaceae bacterium]|nr:MFS transporter [Polyangiaceae bacterium]
MPAPLSTRLRLLYSTEALASIAGALFTAGLPFYTHYRFGWGAQENLLLGAGQGIAYSFGALSAEAVARRVGRRRALLLAYAVLSLMAGAVAAAAVWRLIWAFVLVVLGVVALLGTTWPMVESLVSEGADAKELSRRLARYNVTWAVTGAASLAGSGAVIQYAPGWAFMAITGLVFLGSLGLVARIRSEDGPELRSGVGAPAPEDVSVTPQLAQQRRQALWLSRISLPATYVVVFSLVPMLPSLPAIHRLSPTVATLLASVWLAARAVTFVVTGRTTFWHSRPTLLLYASVLMLLAFLGVVIPAALPGLSLGTAVVLMIPAELALGIALGIIYAGSLYFGMVLSQGSTEHGGYHEALIGLGQTLGPGLAAAMLWVRPGDLWASVAAVSSILGASIVAAGAARFERLWRRGLAA